MRSGKLFLLFKAISFRDDLKGIYSKDKKQRGGTKHYRMVKVQPSKGKPYWRKQLVGQGFNDALNKIDKKPNYTVGETGNISKNVKFSVSMALADNTDKFMYKTIRNQLKILKNPKTKSELLTKYKDLQNKILTRGEITQDKLYAKQKPTSDDLDVSEKITYIENRVHESADNKKGVKENDISPINYDRRKAKKLREEYAFYNISKDKINKIRTSDDPRELDKFAIANYPILHFIVNRSVWQTLNKDKKGSNSDIITSAGNWKTLKSEEREDIVQNMMVSLIGYLKGKSGNATKRNELKKIKDKLRIQTLVLDSKNLTKERRSEAKKNISELIIQQRRLASEYNSTMEWTYDVSKQSPVLDTVENNADGTPNSHYGKSKFGLRVWQNLSGKVYDYFKTGGKANINAISMQTPISDKAGGVTELGDLLQAVKDNPNRILTAEGIQRGVDSAVKMLKNRIVEPGMNESQIIKKLNPLKTIVKRAEKSNKAVPVNVLEKIKTLEGTLNRVQAIPEKERITKICLCKRIS